MKDEELQQRSIVYFPYDTNGKKGNGHYYILLTKQDYNKRSEELLGIPLTSKENDFTLNYGEDISDADIEGDFDFSKKTFVLCDRPCRLTKAHAKPITKQNIKGKVKEEKYRNLCDKIAVFIKYGKKKKAPSGS